MHNGYPSLDVTSLPIQQNILCTFDYIMISIRMYTYASGVEIILTSIDWDFANRNVAEGHSSF